MVCMLDRSVLVKNAYWPGLTVTCTYCMPVLTAASSQNVQLCVTAQIGAFICRLRARKGLRMGTEQYAHAEQRHQQDTHLISDLQPLQSFHKCAYLEAWSATFARQSWHS